VNREISPLDGRYRDRVGQLGDYFSEFALAEARCAIELCYVEALDETGLFSKLSDEERSRITAAKETFGEADFGRIQEIERAIRHDVKACELYCRERLSLANPNLIHFGLTSADVNTLAYARILTRYRDEAQLPQVRALFERLVELAERWKGVPFPARTHGQPASPTTAGKEMAVFVGRLLRQADRLRAFRFRGKLSGATGTYASFAIAFPEFDWIGFADAFVTGLGFEPNRCTTQIDDGDALAEYFGITARINGIVLDLDRDAWEYVSRGEWVQRAADGEVGTSTMPHKVNPIRFENSEGNLTISNALLHALSEKLTASRMQRDLSDTTVRRNIGVALAHAHLALGETMRGLDEIEVAADVARAHVDAAPAVLTEAIQSVLRAEGADDPYETVRRFARGKAMTLDQLRAFVDGLPVSEEARTRLSALRPSDYVGLAERICEETTARARAWLAG